MLKNVYICALVCAAAFTLTGNSTSAATQSDMNQAATASYKKADAQLNSTYRDVFKRVEPAQRTALKAAQNAWIKFRDLDCQFQSSGAAGGSVQSMIVADCLTDKTIERTKALAALLQCEEGDVSCVVGPK